MLPSISGFRQTVRASISAARLEGHDVAALLEEFERAPDSYDELNRIALAVPTTPMRADWQYVEPDDLPSIWRECDARRPLGRIASIHRDDAAARVETAFLSSVCGCILGKPLEVDPTLAELREALEPRGEWPLRDYVSRELNVRGNHSFHPDARTTWREVIAYAAPDCRTTRDNPPARIERPTHPTRLSPRRSARPGAGRTGK